ncbi:RNA polymerase II elongation factor ELL3 isoform X2 [Sminthopsis crassicaudata]|uniref:RNA polymerase II elongation factor ELL3 isoform X2 n=1 Tax=Sminthopsis crassicaudata TaxID=9301 RepID=UPI003D686329
MAGPQEPLSGRLRLSFTPGPRTSLLLLRLNDSALRALQDCNRIQLWSWTPPATHQPPTPKPCLFPLLCGRKGAEDFCRFPTCLSHLEGKYQRSPYNGAEDTSWSSALPPCLPQAQPVITFRGNRGYLRLPGPGCSCLFSFIVSQCGADGPRGGLDLVRHRLGRSGPGLLRCLGPLRERITICSAVDSVPVSSSLQENQQGEGARETRNQQGNGLHVGPQPQLFVEEAVSPFPKVLDPLENSQELQPIPGSSRDHPAQDPSPHPTKGPDQRPSSLSSQRHLNIKRHPSLDLPEPEDKRPRGPSTPQELPSHDPQEGEEWEQDHNAGARQEHSSLPQAGKIYGGDSSCRVKREIFSFHSLVSSTGPEPLLPRETPDYFLQYGVIHSTEQCRVYEQDFEADYAEYRALHARVGAVSRRFMQLGMEIKRVQRGTPEHKVLEDKIVQEYKKFRKRCPGYKEERQRCEYLHQKLSHIKSLILEFEKNGDS